MRTITGRGSAVTMPHEAGFNRGQRWGLPARQVRGLDPRPVRLSPPGGNLYVWADAQVGVVIAVAVVAAGCSPKKMGISRMADALSSTASTFTRDNDPEFVRQAAPSTLKMVEMLLEESPAHPGAADDRLQRIYPVRLRVPAVGRGRGGSSTQAAKDLKVRGAAMYDRARGYCLRALEVRHPGAAKALQGIRKRCWPR